MGKGITSSLRNFPLTVSAAALTELKKMNFFAFDAKNQSKIRYDLAVPDELAFGKAINVEKMLKKTPKLLILDSGDITAGIALSISVNLIESLKLDQTYEMVLEFITMQNITALEANNMLALEIIPSSGSGAIHFNTHSNINEYLKRMVNVAEIA